MKILIVEDDEIFLALMTLVAKNSGYEVVAASTYAEAMKKFAESFNGGEVSDFDLVSVDGQFPTSDTDQSIHSYGPAFIRYMLSRGFDPSSIVLFSANKDIVENFKSKIGKSLLKGRDECLWERFLSEKIGIKTS